jgi:hypothetical protein
MNVAGAFQRNVVNRTLIVMLALTALAIAGRDTTKEGPMRLLLDSGKHATQQEMQTSRSICESELNEID